MAVLGIDKFLKPKEQEPKVAEGGMPEAKEVKTEATATADIPASKLAPVPAQKVTTPVAAPIPAAEPVKAVEESKSIVGGPGSEAQRENKINATAKNLKKAFDNPEFAKLAGISEDKLSDARDVYYSKGGFDEEDYNEFFQDEYKSDQEGPYRFVEEMHHFPGSEVALKSALGKELPSIAASLGYNPKMFEPGHTVNFETEEGDEYLYAIDDLMAHLYKKGTPEQIKVFGNKLRSWALKAAAAKMVD